MKANILVPILLFAAISFAYSQKLSDFYKKESVQLQPVTEFAQNANWAELFNDYKTIAHGQSVALSKKIVVANDGSIFMSHRNKYEIWKFDKNGNFVKKIGSRGSKPGQFVYVPAVEGIMDNKYLVTSDYDGRINFFDFDGNYIKTVKLDYMPLAIKPLKGGKFAVLSSTLLKSKQVRNFLRIIDFNTGADKEIWQGFESINDNIVVLIKFPNDKGMMSCSVPFAHPMATRFQLGTSKSGNLIVASPKTGEVKEYSSEGQLITTFKLNITPLKITDEDIQKQYAQALKNEQEFEKERVYTAKNKWTEAERKEIVNSYKQQVENYKDRKYYPEHLPYFSSLVIDSDGNLLVFEYTKEEDKTNNKFQAYSYDMKGNYLGTSSFKSDAFDLSFTNSSIQFYNGYIYTIANKAGAKNPPPQIAKLKLQ